MLMISSGFQVLITKLPAYKQTVYITTVKQEKRGFVGICIFPVLTDIMRWISKISNAGGWSKAFIVNLMVLIVNLNVNFTLALQ